MSPARRRTLLAAALAAAFAALAGWDLGRAPERQWTARVELAAIARYRAWLSPLLGRAGVVCRFEPTCSRYAEAAIRKHGALGGTVRALGRIARCGPWTPRGTIDLP